MAVYKVTQKFCRDSGTGWAVIPSETLENTTLPPASHRVLMWMLAKPATWGFNMGHIARTFQANKGTVSRWMKPLIDERYVDRTKIHVKEYGYWDWSYTAYPLPLPRLVEALSTEPEVESTDTSILPFVKQA